MKYLDRFICLIATGVCIIILPTVAACATSWVLRILFSFLYVILVGVPTFTYFKQAFNHDRN